jgi:hypothetical protein
LVLPTPVARSKTPQRLCASARGPPDGNGQDRDHRRLVAGLRLGRAVPIWHCHSRVGGWRFCKSLETEGHGESKPMGWVWGTVRWSVVLVVGPVAQWYRFLLPFPECLKGSRRGCVVFIFRRTAFAPCSGARNVLRFVSPSVRAVNFAVTPPKRPLSD